MVPARATTNAAGDRRRARSARVRIGYGRVSTRDQHLEAQHDALTAAGCEQVYVGVASGKLVARPELDKTLACLREGAGRADRCLSEELIAERREEARRAGGVPASAA
jgi:DNA invertase Pin-like site-specific DNA recombinase